MSGPDKSLQDFVQRWSRRKLAIAERAGEAPNAPECNTESPQPNPPAEASPDPAAGAFDPANLPTIESINATSDIRAFLAPGVPIELTRAALRRAWVSDPTIRDFIGLAENQWDFTKPDGVPGFGTLELTPELRRMVAGLFDAAPADAGRSTDADGVRAARADQNSGKTAAPDLTATALPAAASPVVAASQAIGQAADNHAAMQNDFAGDDPSQMPAHRTHGRALPK